MRTKHLLGIGVLALLALSCNNDEVVTSPSDGLITITASYETQGDDTRAVVSETGVFTWVEGDAAAFYTDAKKFVELKSSKVTEDGATATFSGIIVGADLDTYAVFPSSRVTVGKKYDLTSNSFTVNLKSEFDQSTTLNAPMLAKWESDHKTYPFKHLGGILLLQIKRSPSNAKYLKLESANQIAGDFTVDLSAEEPTINTATSETDNSVLVTLNTEPTTDFGILIDQRDIYIPLPVGTYTDLKVSFLDSEQTLINHDGYEYTATISGDNSIARRNLAKYAFAFVDIVGVGEEYTIADLQINSELAAQQDGDETEVTATEPVSYVMLSKASSTKTTLNLSGGAANGQLTITEEDGTESQEESTGDVYVNLASSDDDTATDAIIEAGSKSVYLVSGNIGTATSTTAGTTLVIQKGATVQKIILKGGNIKLESGVTIPAFEDGRTDKTQTVYVINETGETLTLPDGWMAVASAEYVDIYKFVSEVNNTSDGGTFKLERDYTFPAGLSIPTRTFTIDLNGHTIKALSGIVNMFTINKSHITITDSSADKSGTIDAYATSQCAIRVLGNYGSAKHGEASLTINGGNIIGKNQAIWAYAAAQVTVTGGTITADNSAIDAVDYNEGDEPTEIYVKGNAELIAKGVSGVSSGTCVCLWPLKNSTAGKIKLEVTSNDVKMTTLYEGFAISGNGTYHGTEITITGGTFKSAGNALYHPQDGILKISGGTFDGQKSGIEVRSGTLEITGGKFISHADPPSSFANGSGTTSNGSALAIAQHTTKKPISVKISGGEFDGAYAFFEHNPQNNDAESIATITLDIKGGTFSGNVYSEDKTGFISGGKYSADPSTYVADGYSASEDGNGYWVVQ